MSTRRVSRSVPSGVAIEERKMDAGFHPPEPRPLQGSKTSMKCSVEEILAAFTSQDVSNLEEEALYNVLKLFPTNDQMGRFGASTVDPNLSKTVVELYVKMIQMPFVDKILEVALFKVPFSHRVSQLSKDLHLLHQLSKEAKRSATLRQVLDMIPTSHFALPAHLPAPPPPPSVSNPMFQALPDLDRGNRSKVPPSPPLPPTPPPTPSPSQSNLESYSEQHSAAALQGLKEVKPKTKSPVLPPPPPPLPPPPRAHLVWRTQFVEALENCPNYTWEVQNGAPEVNRVDMKQGCCPAPPPLPSSWDLWAPKCGTYQRVARRHEVKELAVITSQLKKTEDGIHASRIEYGYAKLKAGGHKKSKIMLELCRTLSKQSADLMEFCIDSEIPCLKDAAGTDLEVQSWRYCQRELLHLRTEFDKAIVLWKTSIRKCVDTKSTRDMLDAFFSKGEQDLVDLSKFIREVESSTGNLLYHLEADEHKRRNGYLDEDEPIVSIFLKFVECFKATAADLELEKKRALQLPKVNLLDAIFSSEYLDVDHLINLVSFCPSKVQLDMFKNLVKEEGSTAKAQEKLSALLTAPKIHGKLKLLFIKKNLRAQAEKLRFRLTNLIEAAKEIMQSVELNRVVGVVALLSRTHSHGPSAPSEGEDLNDQAASNRASHNCKGGSDGKFLSTAGINLSVLYQLRSKTLLELVKYIAEKHPELLEFYKSLPHLESGTNAAEDLLAIADDIRALLRSVEDVESELKDLQSEADKCADGASDAGPSSSTMSLWRTFLLEAEADYQSVLKVWRDARRSSTELVDFFHQNRILFRVQDGLSAIQSFVKRFQQAAEAIASEEKGSEVNRLLESERTAAGLDTQEDHGLKNEETGIEAPEEEKEKPFPRIHQIFAV